MEMDPGGIAGDYSRRRDRDAVHVGTTSCSRRRSARLFLQPRTVMHQLTRQLSSTIYTLRHVVLLLCPIIYTFLPLAPSKPDANSLIPVLANAQNTLRLTNLTRTAIKRDPRFRRATAMSGDDEAAAAIRARSDEHVKQAIVDVGLDLDATRLGAQRWVQTGWQSLVRVEQ
jgi:hypothetical protein